MSNDDQVQVEVVYAKPERQVMLTVTTAEPLSVTEAIRRSGILQEFPEIELESAKVGVFGKATKKERLLRDGDRVEIYRPLIVDPKEMRRKRAAAKSKNVKK